MTMLETGLFDLAMMQLKERINTILYDADQLIEHLESLRAAIEKAKLKDDLNNYLVR